jgi:hypothetical protein
MAIPGTPVETIGEILRNASLQQVRQFSGCESIEVRSMDSGFELGQVISRRMTLIVISGAEMSILLKLHFKSSEGARLRRIRPSTHTADEAATIAETTDCMKELTNLICGQICRTFQRNNLTLGMCIPLAMRGFYELYADYTPSEKPLKKFGQAWQLAGDFGTLTCTAYVEITDLNALTNLQHIDEAPVNDDEEMEFL